MTTRVSVRRLHVLAAVLAALLVGSCSVSWLSIFGPTDVVSRGDDPELLHDFVFDGSLADDEGDAAIVYQTSDAVFVADSTGGNALALTLAGTPDAVRVRETSTSAYAVEYELSATGGGYALSFWFEPQGGVFDFADGLTVVLTTSEVEIRTFGDEEPVVYAPEASTLALLDVRYVIDNESGSFAGLNLNGRYPGAGFFESFDSADVPFHLVISVDDRGAFALYVNGERLVSQTSPYGVPRGASTYATIVLGLEDYSGGNASIARVHQAQLYSEGLTAAEVRSLYEEGPE